MERSYSRQIVTSENVSGLTIDITSTIRKLSKITMVMAMDETCGTNSAGIGLFTVFAEVDGGQGFLLHILLR